MTSQLSPPLFGSFASLSLFNLFLFGKAACRAVETNLRFLLDSLPLRHMDIESKHGAGEITEAEAQKRHKNIASRAHFLSVLDGTAHFLFKANRIAVLLLFAFVLALVVAANWLPVGDRTVSLVLLGSNLLEALVLCLAVVAFFLPGIFAKNY
jgi:flagellar biosynthesis component FlhA